LAIKGVIFALRHFRGRRSMMERRAFIGGSPLLPPDG
jgi:hypothetical protein